MFPRLAILALTAAICAPALGQAQHQNFVRSVQPERLVVTYQYFPDRRGHQLFDVSSSTEGSSTVRAVSFFPMPIGQYPGLGMRVNHRHGVDGLIVSIADQRQPIRSIPMFIDQRLMFTFGRQTDITQVVESYGQNEPHLTLIGFAFEISSHANRDLTQRGEFFVQGEVYPFGTFRGQAGMLITDRVVGRHHQYGYRPSIRVSWATHTFRLR